MQYYYKFVALAFFIIDLVSTILDDPSETALTLGLIFIMVDAIKNVKE